MPDLAPPAVMPVVPARGVALARTWEPLAAPAHKRAASGAPYEDPIGKLRQIATDWGNEGSKRSALKSGRQRCDSSRILTMCGGQARSCVC